MNELRDRVVQEVRKVVVGQDGVVEVLLAAVTVGGHILLEGVPGVAKTLVANAFARAIGVDFRRVQFTPDMLPSDLTGTMTLRSGELAFRQGPVFTNLLLADEINRTPPKTQAALLEAMQERQVSVDGVSRPLPDPFIVVATQNPIEYEGTYALPEAQLDRFLAKIDVGYPGADDEAAILRLRHNGVAPATLDDVRAVTSPAELVEARATVDATTVSDAIVGYVVTLVRRTRELPSLSLGASPRGAVHLLAAAKA
ncbi:MAG: MoxR-like ATPase, partial [Actinomycetota bacterium]|nr:MoxR-like ATPase [Actinomycetota bacterium]